MDPMRREVIHLVPSSGRNPWLNDLTAGLRARGQVTPVVVTLALPGELHRDAADLGVEAISLQGRTSRDLRAIFRLADVLRRRPGAIVHTHVLDPAIVYSMSRWLATPDAPWVSTRHQPPGFIDLASVPEWKRRLFRIVDGWTHRRMDRVIAISARSARELLGLGVRHERVAEIPLGFDLRRLQPDRSVVRAVRAELAGDAPLVVCVARLSWEKNLSFLLSAWSRITAALPQARLAMVGTGPLETPLLREAAASGLQGVAFLGYRRDALAIIGAADVVVQPSLAENMSMVGIEALAQARPLVATPVGIVGERLLDAEHCLVAPCDDAGAFSAAVIRLLKDRPLGMRLGAAGRELVHRDFGLDTLLGRYEELYAMLFRQQAAR